MAGDKAKKAVKPKKAALSDAERHRRFVETARALAADENPEAFDRAFANVVKPVKPE